MLLVVVMEMKMMAEDLNEKGVSHSDLTLKQQLTAAEKRTDLKFASICIIGWLT